MSVYTLQIVQIRKLIKKEMNYISTMEKEKERGSVQKREKGKRERREGERERRRGERKREPENTKTRCCGRVLGV